MLKIGEFSKLSLTTVKALRFYEKEGLLIRYDTLYTYVLSRIQYWTAGSFG